MNSARNCLIQSRTMPVAIEEDVLTAYEHAKKAGLIGAARGASRDLSTNPKHFDGFGSS
jgi:hypothetical protein